MTNDFINQSDLDKHGFVREEWLQQKGLSGILFPETPTVAEFNQLIQLVGTKPLRLNVFFAEFGKDFTQVEFFEIDTAYRYVRSIFFREIFVQFVFQSSFFVFWIPQEHDFYAIFGRAIDITYLYKTKITALSKDLDEYFADEEFFSQPMRDHMQIMKKKYFTA